jgi:hypothetical protein
MVIPVRVCVAEIPACLLQSEGFKHKLKRPDAAILYDVRGEIRTIRFIFYSGRC